MTSRLSVALTLAAALATACALLVAAPGGRTEAGVPTPTDTPADTATATDTPLSTDTPTPVDTDTPTSTPTSTDTPTPTPTDTATATPTAGFALALDCDTASPGVQGACGLDLGAAGMDVDVVFQNGTGAAVAVAGFTFKVRDPDTSRISPPPGAPLSIDGNPDFNQSAFPPGWGCPAPSPQNDTGEDGPGTAVSHLACFGPPELASIVPAGGDIVVATVRYDVAPGASIGNVTLTPSSVALFDASFAEIGSCDPVVANPLPCAAAVISLGPPSPTPTPTITSTPTPTATPGPIIPALTFQPEGNANNVDPIAGAANLWVCTNAARCTGPGEGALDVLVHATDIHTLDGNADEIEDGLAAYALGVAIDTPLVSASICDVVFSPGGSGEARGPVSKPAPSGCAPNSPPHNGACTALTLLLLRFTCSTPGTALGPIGDFDLARMRVTPSPNAVAVLYPGVTNGFVALVYGADCTLLDPAGQPVVGAGPDGRLGTCGQLAISVRILEGDMNLDCTVDIIDLQMMAYRYGAAYPSPLYTAWYDVEPEGHDLDVDASDLQRVFGRAGSTCQAPIPVQPPDPGS